jgi:hypothetical protein
MRQLRGRQVPYSYGSVFRKLLCDLRRQHLLWDAWGYCRQHLCGMSYQLSVCQWLSRLDELSLQRWVHGTKRRELHGVCGGDVQCCPWGHVVRRMRRRQVFHDDRRCGGEHVHCMPRELAVSQRVDYLCLHGRLHGTRRGAVPGVCCVEVQGGDRQCIMHRLRDQFRTRVDSADRRDPMCVQPRVHGTRRGGVRGVRGGEVQGGLRLCPMHRLRRRQVFKGITIISGGGSFSRKHVRRLWGRHLRCDDGSLGVHRVSAVLNVGIREHEYPEV